MLFHHSMTLRKDFLFCKSSSRRPPRSSSAKPPLHSERQEADLMWSRYGADTERVQTGISRNRNKLIHKNVIQNNQKGKLIHSIFVLRNS